MATIYSRRPSGRRDLGRDWKEGGEGISGDARRKRLTAPWIHNFYLRLVEMIAMQSYNGFGRLRVQKFRKAFIDAITICRLGEYMIIIFFEFFKSNWNLVHNLILSYYKYGSRPNYINNRFDLGQNQ